MQWLCDCYLPSLWRYVYMRVRGDAHLAEDVTSDTVLAMLTMLETSECGDERDAAGPEIRNLAGWLRTVAQRRISDHFRAASRVQHLLQGVAGGSERSEPDLAARQEVEESRAAVRRAMDGLGDQHRLALEWKYLDNLSVREIAARWEITEKAAESILFRARREFRERLEKPCLGHRSELAKPAAQKNASAHDESDQDEMADAPEDESAKAEAAHEMSKE
jgi:RNA polymerase sigma factor (sigma-70 family)